LRCHGGGSNGGGGGGSSGGGSGDGQNSGGNPWQLIAGALLIVSCYATFANNNSEKSSIELMVHARLCLRHAALRLLNSGKRPERWQPSTAPPPQSP